jgi:hypothetical protein
VTHVADIHPSVDLGPPRRVQCVQADLTVRACIGRDGRVPPPRAVSAFPVPMRLIPVTSNFTYIYKILNIY